MTEQKPIPSDREITKLCQTLARKYKNRQEYDDLVSEGVVACYECKAEGKGHKKDYVGAARRAMNDYINVKTKSMSIPDTWPARTVSHAMSTGEDLNKLEGVKGGTLKSLMDAMSNETVDIEELEASTPDHAIKYEKDDYSQETLADELGVDKSTISRREEAMLNKLRQSL